MIRCGDPTSFDDIAIGANALKSFLFVISKSRIRLCLSSTDD